jgi:hypothetical protein
MRNERIRSAQRSSWQASMVSFDKRSVFFSVTIMGAFYWKGEVYERTGGLGNYYTIKHYYTSSVRLSKP